MAAADRQKPDVSWTDKVPVGILRAALAAHGQPTDGNRDELLARLEAAMPEGWKWEG